MTGYIADLSWKSGARAIEKLDRLRSTTAVNVLILSCAETCNIRLFWDNNGDCIVLDVTLTKILNEMRYKWKEKYNFRTQTIPFKFVIKEKSCISFNLKRVPGTEYIADRLDLLSASPEIFLFFIFPELSLRCSFVCWISVTLLSGLDTRQAASHRSHSVEALIPSQVSSCGLYDGQTDIVTGFSPLSPLSIIPPILHTHIFSLSATNQLQT